ncbi:hypothetical protein PROFUN_10962 [Planoprotostelium fungivorum]|uniref:G8 domain-containing protein n=1 Tax=Planoprotostelium fungivorum TaxID=1890364 RepID=A0A2P6NBX6_9EUKA|nr:hypothetical protein PROFUN_10962 [Planoprotostelium fungivorum]
MHGIKSIVEPNFAELFAWAREGGGSGWINIYPCSVLNGHFDRSMAVQSRFVILRAASFFAAMPQAQPSRLLGSLLVFSLFSAVFGATGCIDASGYLTWSSQSAWNTVGANITVPSGSKYVLDKSPGVVLGYINIAGDVVIQDTVLELMARGIVVASGGSLRAGSLTCPITTKVTITLYGKETYDNPMGRDPLNGDTAFGDKGLWMASGGTLQLYGWKSGPSWTTLSATARAGDSSVRLTDAVSWKIGDTIMIASTDFFDQRNSSLPEQHETRVITSVSTDGKTVSFTPGLTYMHFGIYPTNAEVGLLTRHIVVQGDNSSVNTQWGANIGMRGTKGAFGAVLSGVEVTKSGQAGLLGRYPIHFHNMSQVFGQNISVTDCSIHHNYQRCISVHASFGVLVQDNVAFNTYSHCYFLEDGSEMGNQFLHNLGSLVRSNTNATRRILDSDSTPAVFWITNMNNTFYNNAASGADSGFWIGLSLTPGGISEALYPNLKPINIPAAGMGYNTAHSVASFGLDNSRSVGTNGAFDPRLGDETIRVPNIWSNFVVYKGLAGGIWVSSGGMYVNMTIADCAFSMVKPTPGQIFVNLTIIGDTGNIGPGGFPTKPVCGMTNYPVDGGIRVINTTFVNFTRPNVAAHCHPGGDQWANTVNNVLYNNVYINSPMNLMVPQIYNISSFTRLDDGAITGFPAHPQWTGGSWQTGPQPYWQSAASGCEYNIARNKYACPLRHGSFSPVFFHTGEQTSSFPTAGSSTTDQNVYQRQGIPSALLRPLTSDPALYVWAPSAVMNAYRSYLFKIPSNNYWHFQATNADGTYMPTPVNLMISMNEDAPLGVWHVFSIPYPSGTSFIINQTDRNPYTNNWETHTFTPVTSVKDLSLYKYYWDGSNLWLFATTDGGKINYGGLGFYWIKQWSQDSQPIIGQINAQMSGSSSPAYSTPSLPSDVIAARFQGVGCLLYTPNNTNPNIGGKINFQIYPQSYYGVPTFAYQIYHNAGLNLTISFVDKVTGKTLLEDAWASQQGGNGFGPVSLNFWNKLYNTQVRVEGRLFGQLVLSQNLGNNQNKFPPPSLPSGTVSCMPSYGTMDLFNDTLYKSVSVTRGSIYNTSLSMCGQSVVALNTSQGRAGFQWSNKLSVPTQYNSLEFFVRLIQPRAPTVQSIPTRLWVLSQDSNSQQYITYVNATNSFNYVTNSLDWNMVRIPLSQLGGWNLTYGLFLYTDDPAPGLYVDNLRFSTSSATVSSGSAPDSGLDASRIVSPTTSGTNAGGPTAAGSNTAVLGTDGNVKSGAAQTAAAIGAAVILGLLAVL